MKRTPLKIFTAIFASLLCFSACNARANAAPMPDIRHGVDIYPPTPRQMEAPIPETSQNGEFWNVSDVDISRVDKTRKLISLTFDDAPSRTLENILAVFAAFNEDNPDCPAAATVFFNGGLFDENTPQLLHAACALGFELGNHTQSHADLTKLSAAELAWEIEETDKRLAEIDGKPRHLFRAPFGKLNEQVKATVKTPIVDWTIDTLDWTGVSENEIYDTVWNNKFSGAIVLMHDGHTHTVSALKRLLPDLKDAGYQVVSISAMAKAHDCPLRNGGVYIRARKNRLGN